MRKQPASKESHTHVTLAPGSAAINAVSRHLVSACPDPTLTAEALAERALYQPNLPIKPTIDTSKVSWDVVLPRLQAVCRTIAVTMKKLSS